MSYNWGTLELIDTLRQIDSANVFEYGEDRLYEHVRDLLAAHNVMTGQMFNLFVESSTDHIRRFGATSVEGEMVEVDEYGHADVQKTAVAGYDIGFPLRSYQYSIGWTRKYFEVKTVADIAKELVAAQEADVKNLKRQILRALTRATNYSFVDFLDTGQTLPCKALINADGTAIPVNQYGDTFDGSTHTHLLARAGASLAASDITAAIDTVVEHGVGGGQVLMLINRAQEAAVSAMAPFTPLQAPLIDPGPGSTDDVPRFARANPYQIDDRPIGIWDGYVVVHTKPWVPSNYLIFVLVGAGDRPLVMRRRAVQGYGEFRLVAEHEHYPLRARHFEREFGVSVWGRLSASILYAGGTTYVAPTIA